MRCIIVDDDKISRELIRDYILDTPDLELLGEFPSAIEANNFLSKNHIDLIFLDVEMPKMSGIELLKSLDEKPIIILTTSQDKYAVEAFENEVSDYLVKPIEYPRFLKAVNKAKNTLRPMPVDSYASDSIFIKVDSELINLPYKEIMWIEALGDYVNIITPTKKHVVLSTMKNIEGKLPPKEFIRVHRSYFVRVDKIKKISEDIILVENKLIPVSKSYKKELLERLNML
jgi:DNA-binding LytR/AlgR family response regulator